MSYPTAQSPASSVRPLLAGDELDGQLIRGFAWTPPPVEGQRSNHHDDKLLLEGDELLPEPPNRAVPTSSDGAVPKAPVPPADLGPERVLPAAEVDPDLATRVDALLNLPTAQWQPLIRPLLAAVHATGHRLWLSGGAVRDSVSNVPVDEINDLDMAGTAPPGRFMDMMYQAMRASGKTEHVLKVSKDSLICSVTGAGNTRFIEYRGLSLGGFSFPAVGSRLAEDARHRDFSFNALIYDALDHILFDPTGHGLADLLRKLRTFRPIKESDSPYELATVVVRAMKFALRWPGRVDLDLFHRWLHSLPADIWRSLTEDELSMLRDQRRRLKYPRGKQREFAATVPEPGRELLMSLLGRV
jgi:poly(A) polymerase